MSHDSVRKYIKIAFHGTDVQLSDSCTEVVKRLICDGKQAEPSNVGDCCAVGETAVPSLSFFVAARSISEKWPWMKITNVLLGGQAVEITLRTEKATKFHQMLQERKIEKNVEENFEDLDSNLMGLLARQTYEEHGDEVKRLLEAVRLKSLKEVKLPKAISVGKKQTVNAVHHVCDAKAEIEASYQTNIVGGGNSDIRAQNGADMKYKATGGMNFVGNVNPDVVRAAINHRQTQSMTQDVTAKTDDVDGATKSFGHMRLAKNDSELGED